MSVSSWDFVAEPEQEAATAGDSALAAALGEVEELKSELEKVRRELARVTGERDWLRVQRDDLQAARPPPAQQVPGQGDAFPVAASSTGKRYYSFRGDQPGGPAIVAGAAYACELLGGRWVGHGHGRSPTGFGTLEEALNWVARSLGLCEVRIRWRPTRA